MGVHTQPLSEVAALDYDPGIPTQLKAGKFSSGNADIRIVSVHSTDATTLL